ncbi:MAG: hypothetical protein AB7U45_03860 [Desulfamplus sp.]
MADDLFDLVRGAYSAFSVIDGFRSGKQARRGISKQMDDLEFQSVANQAISRFNDTISDLTGDSQMSVIALQTRGIVSDMRVSFAAHGVDPFRGSPLMVQGEAIRMGNIRMQEVAFNRDLESANSMLRSEMMTRNFEAAKEKLYFKDKKVKRDVTNLGYKTVNLLDGFFKTGTLPSFGLFDL